MRLDLRGHPLHTRALSVTIVAGDGGAWRARASVLDLRKRGFVPVGGDLQASGIVHHMQLDADVDPATGTVPTIAARMPSVAFEASALTRGESCRDVAGGVAALAGARVDAGWAATVGGEIGGRRGCSHVLTLAQLLGPTVAWALARERALHPDAPARRPGERIFRRDVIVDGAEEEPMVLGLGLQLLDVHHRPVERVVASMDRFAEAFDVRAHARVAVGTQALRDLTVAERRRGRDTLDAPWTPRDDVAARLAGLSLGRGVSAALVERVAAPQDRPLLDALLALAPALIQVYAAVSETWPEQAARDGWLIGLASRPDACWMWRADGPLLASRAPTDPVLF
jgi:hypothetical protein